VSADYQILVTDKQLRVVGDPIVCWTMIQVTLKFNEPDSGSFTCPGYSWIRDQLTAGCRVVIIRNGLVLTAGPLEKLLWERSDDGDNAGAGTLTINFSDFTSLLAARQTYPNPALTPATQVIDNWTFTGQGEDALRALVDGNAGPSALTARQIPQLVLGTLAGVGGAVTAKADRMEPMGDVMRRIAVSAGGIGFRTAITGGIGTGQFGIEFQVFQPTDLSNQVIFGFGAGSLKYIAYEATAPTTNAVIVGGQGDGADRFVTERDNAGSQDVWDRREALVSQPGNDPIADLNTAGDAALADGAETARVPISVMDTPFQTFGVDYDIGSRVSVETFPGTMISDVVVTVSIEVYPTSGEVVTPTVGSQAANADPIWLQMIRSMNKRMSYLERNVVPSTP
jgi:hypothetical protein